MRCCFNSNMVRLKVSIKSENFATDFKFQFQYGSIKSKLTIYLVRCLQRFQFQYGSIKRQQFKATFHNDTCFNSNMVRLKDKCRRSVCGFLAEFQFQYGSIKRQRRVQLHIVGVRSFNSNMVRLKELWVTEKKLCYFVVSIPIWFD